MIESVLPAAPIPEMPPPTEKCAVAPTMSSTRKRALPAAGPRLDDRFESTRARNRPGRVPASVVDHDDRVPRCAKGGQGIETRGESLLLVPRGNDDGESHALCGFLKNAAAASRFRTIGKGGSEARKVFP